MATLAQLRVGDRAKVARISGTDDLAMRLMEMGITPGVELHFIGKAPLGDPLELEVRGYRLSVRIIEAQRIETTPL